MPDPLRFVEPTRRLPLRWGGYRTRLLGGFLLIVSGGVAVAGASPYANWLFVIGMSSHLTGWAILPSDGWRRVVALIPSAGATVFLLAGPTWFGALVAPYLGWLLVRHRPASAYPTALIVLAGAGVVARLATGFRDMPWALGAQFALMVVSALAARAVHAGQDRMRRGRKPRDHELVEP